MNSHKQKSIHINTHASKKLRINLRILTLVYLVLFVIAGYNVIVSQAIFWQVVLAIFIGVTAGVISSRMYKISWSSDEAKVIGRIDIYGVIVLITFVVFELNRSRIAALFASGESIGTIGLVLITSALFGRVFGTSKKILRILNEEKII